MYMYMPLGAHYLAVNYEEAQAPDVWVPSSQEKEDTLCFFVFTAQMWVQKKSAWSAKVEKRNIFDRHPWLAKMLGYMPPFCQFPKYVSKANDLSKVCDFPQTIVSFGFV
jgi:hypothetical protein